MAALLHRLNSGAFWFKACILKQERTFQRQFIYEIAIQISM
jgi:hypothetical protein